MTFHQRHHDATTISATRPDPRPCPRHPRAGVELRRAQHPRQGRIYWLACAEPGCKTSTGPSSQIANARRNWNRAMDEMQPDALATAWRAVMMACALTVILVAAAAFSGRVF